MENYIRKPNTECFFCKKKIYRRPSELKKRTIVYCSHACKKENWPNKRVCAVCGLTYRPSHYKNKTCSRICSNKNRTGLKYSKSKYSSNSERNLAKLKNEFNFTHCMLEGCQYKKVFDVHRLVAGRFGGQYEIGNMFAICPNHHAEIERGIIRVEKVNNFTLRIVI